jgi:hypothetical protein
VTSPRSILRAASDRLRVWWEGAYIPPDKRGNSALAFLQGHHEQHWTSRASHAAWDYFKEHHRWIIGLLFGLLVAMLVKARTP